MRLRIVLCLAVMAVLATTWTRAGAAQGIPGAGTPIATPTPAPATGPTAPNAPSPFGSPTPSSSPGPIGNGFVIAGYNSGNGTGGVIATSTATPLPNFPSSNATGFFVDIAGRLSAGYAAMLRFNDYGVHGGGNPVLTRSEGALYYTPGGGVVALGVGLISMQSSNFNASANALGIGASLLPDFQHTVSPYVNLFYYPSAKSQNVSASITTAQAGAILRLKRSGVLFKIGYDHQSYANPGVSPTSLGGIQLGLGASF